MSSVRKTALCDQLPRGARTSMAWPWVLLGPHPFSVPKYSKTSRHNCPQEKPVLNWGVCLCLIQGRHVRPVWKRGCDELNLPHSSTNENKHTVTVSNIISDVSYIKYTVPHSKAHINIQLWGSTSAIRELKSVGGQSNVHSFISVDFTFASCPQCNFLKPSN